MKDDIPDLKPIEPHHVECCAHVKPPNAKAIHAAITLQSISLSKLVPVTTLLCTGCALLVSEAVAGAIQAGYEKAKEES